MKFKIEQKASGFTVWVNQLFWWKTIGIRLFSKNEAYACCNEYERKAIKRGIGL